MNVNVHKEQERQGTRQSAAEYASGNLLDDVDSADSSSWPPSKVVEEVASSAPLKSSQSNSQPKSNSQPTPTGTGLTAPDPKAIIISHPKEMDQECNTFMAIFEGKETEQNWEARELSLQRLRGLLRGGAPSLPTFLPSLKLFSEPIFRTLHSLRTALVITCCTVVSELAMTITVDLDPFVDLFLTHLIQIAASTKKLVMSASVNAIRSILLCSTFHQKNLSHFSSGIISKSQNIRQISADCLRLIIERGVTAGNSHQAFERTGCLDTIEKTLKKGLQDANDRVRESSRDVHYFYAVGWPDRAARLLDSMDPSARKAMQRHKKPSPTPMILSRTHSANSTHLAQPSQTETPIKDQYHQTNSLSPKPTTPHGKSAFNFHSPVHTIPKVRLDTHDCPDGVTQPGIDEVSVHKRPRILLDSKQHNIPSPQPQIPVLSAEDAILAQLCSLEFDEKLQGFYSLLNIAQESSLAKQKIPFTPESLKSMRLAILLLYTNASGELLTSLLNLEYLLILFEGELLTLSDIYISVLRVLLSPASVHFMELADKTVEKIKDTFSSIELLESLLCKINPFPPSMRIFKKSTSKESLSEAPIDKSLADLVLKQLFYTILQPSEIENTDLQVYLSEPLKMRSVLNKIVPLAHGPRGTKVAISFSLDILRELYRISPDSFKRSMETFDYEQVERTYSLLGLSTDPEIPSALQDYSDLEVAASVDTGDVGSDGPILSSDAQHNISPSKNSKTQPDMFDEDTGQLTKISPKIIPSDMEVDAKQIDETFGDLSRIDAAPLDVSTSEPFAEERSAHISEGESDVLNETLPPGFADTSIFGPESLVSSSAEYRATYTSEQFDNDEGDFSKMSNTSVDMSDDEQTGLDEILGFLPSAVQTSTPHTPSRQIPSIFENSQSKINGNEEIDFSRPPISGMVGAERIYSAPTLGSLEHLVTNHATPAKLRFGRRDGLEHLFATGTPVSKRIVQHDELDQLVNQLQGGVVTQSLIRRFIRISRQDAEMVREDGPNWAQWLGPIILAIKDIVCDPTSEDELQEGCMLLLRELINNQFMYFDGLEPETMYLLLDCRSDGTKEVSGSADAALGALIEKLDRDTVFTAILTILQRWDMSDKNNSGRLIRKLRICSELPIYQPLPAASALIYLGKLVESKFNSHELDDVNRMHSIMDISLKAMNSDSAEIRKACIDALVLTGRVLGTGCGTLSTQCLPKLKVNFWVFI
ncbi:hypothetical protein BASA83_000492 [Batrachochytrium salamandrivorans]|nr:hypothetical protein BASA83_000492 [Batrachochytrium salamandrivorans]